MNTSVNFDARDNGLFGYIDKLSQKASDLNKENIKAALAASNSSKQQLKHVEDLIKAKQKAAQIELQQEKAAAASLREKARDMDENPQEAAKKKREANQKLYDDHKSGAISREEYIAKAREVNSSPEALKGRARDIEKQVSDQLREVKAQTALQREQIETIKVTARNEAQNDTANARLFVRAIEDKGDEASEEEKLKASIMKDAIKEKDDEKKNKNGSAASFAGGYLASSLIQTFSNKFDQLASSKNGFDLIKPASSATGQLVGGGIGAAIGAAISGGTGTLVGASIGSAIGDAIGSSFGEFETRAKMSQQEFAEAVFNNRALTGKGVTSQRDYADLGISRKDFLNLRTDFSGAAGRVMSEGQVAGAYGMQKGYGVEIETSKQLIDAFRSGQFKDLKETLIGVFDKGLDGAFKRDRSFLNEFLSRNFSGLQKELAKTNTELGTATTLDILNRFNKIGGIFSATNNNSMAMITGIQNSLANPGSDMGKAFAFQALKSANPTAGIAELIEKRQQGLSSPSYMKNMLQLIDQMGGNEDMKIMNTAGMFGLEGNMQAARQLYKNRSALMSGELALGDLTGVTSDGEVRKTAAGNTTLLQQNTAQIEDALVSGMVKSIPTMIDAFNAALGSQQIEIVVQGDKATFRTNGNQKIITNKTKNSKGAYDDNTALKYLRSLYPF